MTVTETVNRDKRKKTNNWTISVSGICLPFQMIPQFCRQWEVFTYLLTVSINRLKSIIIVDHSIPRMIEFETCSPSPSSASTTVHTDHTPQISCSCL